MHTLTDDAIAALRSHAWPGNVRELKAAMRRVAILADSKLIRAADLGLGGVARSAPTTSAPAAGAAGGIRELVDGAVGGAIQPLGTLRDEFVRRYVLLAIERSGEDREVAAKALDIGVRTLDRYIS
jgi:DNA-binding NtrC family response regulator